MSDKPMFALRRFERSDLFSTILIFVALGGFGAPAAAQLVFVTDAGSNVVSVVDAGLTPPSVVQTLTVGTAPVGVAFDRGGDRIFVTNSQDGTVSIVDRTLPEVVPVAIGTLPSGVAVSPSGDRLYVTDFDNSTLNVVDLDAEPPVVLTSTPLGAKPDGIAVSADGTRLFVADAEDDTGESTLFLLDATVSPPLVIDSTSVPREPHGIALGPDGTVYLPSSDEDVVTLYDPVTLASLGSVAVPGRPYSLVVAPSGSRLYVVRTDLDTLAVVDLDAQPPTVVDQPTIGSGAFGVGVDATGSRVFVPAPFTGELVTFDATSLPLVEIDRVDGLGLPVSFGLFVADSGEVFGDGFESGDTTAWSQVVP